MRANGLYRSFALTTLATALAACGGGGEAPSTTGPVGAADQRPDREWTDAARVEALAATLQACSYDGAPMKVDPAQLGGDAPADCRTMVDKIMRYTGLPANFIVTAGPVSNAAAVILLDKENIPQRVIAFNPNFMGAMHQVTGGSEWAPASVMAHEIGHHLSGHTIVAGGSRPEIELEADKFSGYVLYKMGAPLAEATKVISKIGSPTEQPTHPGRDRRIAAITQGWEEACRQTGSNCSGGTASPPPATPSPSVPSPATTPAPVATTPAAPLPVPSAQSIPLKYGRFVVDETGKLDPGEVALLEKRLFELASTQGIELALLVTNDLRGMSAQDYTWAMLRQLRVGKLDLGNGGVIVYAPGQKTSAMAFAPGMSQLLEHVSVNRSFDNFTTNLWSRYCADADGCDAGMTKTLLGTLDFPIRTLVNSGVKFQIRFNSIKDIIDHTNTRRAERKAGRKWDNALDQSIGSLVRFSGTVTELDPAPKFLRVNESVVKDGRWRALLVKTEDGKETTLYMQPQTEGLMPGGKLEVGKQYTFTGGLRTPGQFTTDQGVMQGNVEMWLFSYDPL